MNLQNLTPLAFTLAEHQKTDVLLQDLVGGIAGIDGVALARVWLIREADECEACPMSGECLERTRCLHLAASDGASRQAGGTRWNGIRGAYRRFPLGVRKVGRVALTQTPALLRNVETESGWLQDSAWGAAEGIRSFAGLPLVYRGETIGVLGIFARLVFHPDALGAFRTFAGHAAAAIGATRSYEESERLRLQLEAENAALRRELQETARQAALAEAERSFDPVSARIYTEAEMEAVIKRNFERALRAANGKISGAGGAAEILGVHPNTLTARLKTRGMIRPRSFVFEDSDPREEQR